MNYISRKASGVPLWLFTVVTVAALAAATAVYGKQTPSQAAVASKKKPASGASCPDLPAAQNSAAEGPNAPMTRAQGEEILRQLSVIRMLLQRRTLAGVRRPAPIRDVTLPEGKGWHALGNADAPVTMIEFTDLQCPFCRRFETTTFPELKKEYVDTGKVRFISVDLPLPMHQYALGAAEAEQCAAQQGKFWQFRDAVLDDQVPPTLDILQTHASQLGLRMGEFQKCLEGRKENAEVQAGRAAAVTIGIHGTPGFVVGRAEGGVVRGVAFAGARPLPFFERYIDGVLNHPPSAPHEPDRKAGSPAGRSRGGPSGGR